MDTPPSPPGTQAEFGYEWERYPEILPEHEGQFWGWVQPLTAADFRGRRFLDAGCGTGRNSYWALKAGAAAGTAFDYDARTVAVARRNLARFPNAEVAWGSLYDWDRPAAHDIVFCIGVLHHLADPRRAVETLARSAKPGGLVVLWVYAREGNRLLLFFLQPLRLLTSRLPLGWTRVIARVLTLGLRGWLKIAPATPYRRMLRPLSFRHTEAIVFDQLFPSIAHYWSREDVLSLVKGLPLRVRHLTHARGNSWALVAERE